jgi:O-antigen/teichoic acid export membrane protein
VIEAGPSGADRRPHMPSATALTYGTYIGASLCGLLNVIIIARVLGPAGRGEVAFLTTVAGILGFTSSLSVNEALVNRVASRPSERAALAGTAIALAIGLGVAGAALGLLILSTIPSLAVETPRAARFLALAGIPVFVLQTYFLYIARGCYLLSAAAAAWMGAPLVTLVLNASLATAGALSVTRATASWLAGMAGSTLALAAYTVVRASGLGAPERPLAGELTRFGLRSHIGGLFATGSYRLDQWILGGVAGARELGLYSVAVAWFEALLHLPRALATAFRPDLVRRSPAEAGEQAAGLFRACLLVTAVLGAAMALLAPFLCTTIFGEEFRDSVADLRLLIPGALGIAGIGVFGTALIAQNRPLWESAAMGCGFAVALVLYVLLIPRFEGHGAAIASTVSYLVAGVVGALLARRALSVPLGALVPRPSDVARLRDGLLAAARRRPDAGR